MSPTLLERERELELIERCCAASAERVPGVLVVEGEPGIGKSSLLAAARDIARRRGLAVLSARGSEFETDVPYGGVRQLFDRAVQAAPADLLRGAASLAGPLFGHDGGTTRAGPDVSWAVQHGLYWLTANLADRSPVLLSVDDAQWVDPASLRWLLYLMRRWDDLPLLVAITLRPGEVAAPYELIDALRAEPAATSCRPSPLSEDAAHLVAQHVLGAGADPAFARSCHHASGGNPFLLLELLHHATRHGGGASSIEVDQVQRPAPATVELEVARRLRRLGPEAAAVAHAVAVLDRHADIPTVAALAKVTTGAAVAAAGVLIAGRVLLDTRPLEFVHPVVRTALYESLPAPRRAELHDRAARVLLRAGRPSATIAPHLLHSPPSANPDIVSILRRAADDALARGAPSAAITYLSRALDEPPTPFARSDVLRELGTAEALDESPGAVAHLHAALSEARGSVQVTSAALALGQALSYGGEIEAAYEIARDTLDRLPPASADDPLALELEELRLGSAVIVGRAPETAGRVAELSERLSPDSPTACALLGHAAMQALIAGASRRRVGLLVDRALQSDEAIFARHAQFGRETAALVLLWIDEGQRAEAVLTRALEAARRMGLRRSVAYFAAVRGFALVRRGELARAEADLDEAAAVGGDTGDGLALSRLILLIATTRLRLEQGDAPGAARLAAGLAAPPGVGRSPAFALLRHAQGLAELELGRCAAAARTFEEVGAVFTETGVRTPAIVPWRSDLALALAGCDRLAEAVELASVELQLAEECDVDRARGAALRALGLMSHGDERDRCLGSAVDAFNRAGAPLEEARTLIELGASMRRARRRREAREPLRRGLELATAQGATALEVRAGVELAATGARPRPVQRTGLGALTPSELRVATRAGEGMTNREIAQGLFVSIKTVEIHLTRAYQKLGIGGRADLAPLLGSSAGHDAGTVGVVAGVVPEEHAGRRH